MRVNEYQLLMNVFRTLDPEGYDTTRWHTGHASYNQMLPPNPALAHRAATRARELLKKPSAKELYDPYTLAQRRAIVNTYFALRRKKSSSTSTKDAN